MTDRELEAAVSRILVDAARRSPPRLRGTGAREAEGSGLLSRPVSDGRASSNLAPSVATEAARSECGVASAACLSGAKASGAAIQAGPGEPASRNPPSTALEGEDIDPARGDR